QRRRLTTPALHAVAFGSWLLPTRSTEDLHLQSNAHAGHTKEVYVSPSKSSDWEEDILGGGVLEDGAAGDVHFHRSAKTCHWDLKVVYTVDSSSAVWTDIDLCSVEKITIHYDKEADKTSATFD
ncbi:MAG: hypothetical protein ABR878_07980, partial [Roseiarcus sp.]